MRRLELHYLPLNNNPERYYMADRRMMSKKVIHSDAFMDLPPTSKVLYFYLMIDADDDGFVNSPKRIQRMIGSTDDDSRLLLAKKFLLAFESGVIVIKHWRMHNYIRGDRKKDTTHIKERSLLGESENGVYHMSTKCLPSGSIGKVGEIRLEEVSIGEGNKSGGKEKAVKYPDPLQEWIDYRKEIKKPLKESSIKRLLNKHDLDSHSFTLSVDHSIENGYQGLFAPKSGIDKSKKNPLDLSDKDYTKEEF